jgi:outer membrane protein TolC
MKHSILITLLFFISFSNAQEKKETYSFTLNQAIEHALKNNYAAINAKKDIEAAKEKKWETTASGLPQINGNVSYLNNLDFTEQGVTGGGGFGGAPGSVSTITFGTKHSMDARATLSQLIFDGSYIVGLQSAKVYLQISQNAKEKTDLEVREMVTNAYGNVLLARENILILEKNKKSLEKTLFETTETFKNGLVEEENVEQLQITLNQIKSTLSNASKRSDIALQMFKISLGIDISEEVILTESLNEITKNSIDLATFSGEFNIQDNLDYKIGQNNEESKRLLLKLEKFRSLPTLAANLNYGLNSFANQFDFLQQDQRWYNYSNLGVSLNIPIFSSFAFGARKQQAQIAYEQATTQLKQTEQNLMLQHKSTLNDYEYSIEQLATSKSNLDLAERIESKQQIKFKEGLSTSFEFTEAQRQLYSSQQNYLQSMIDVIAKKTALDKITNNK